MVPCSKRFEFKIVICVNYVAERKILLGCADVGEKSTYAISCTSYTMAYPTAPPFRR
jgi:hypothetical protein